MLLLDEPLAALDAKLREEMQIELINLQKEVGITFVYVTHDQTEALALSHRIAVMNQGRVEQLDEPSRIYGFPRTRFVADFIGHCNLLHGTGHGERRRHRDARRRRPGPVRVATQRAVGAGAAAPSRCGPRRSASPRGRAADSPDNHFRGTVADFLYMGDVTVYRVAHRGRRSGSRRCSPIRRAGAPSSSRSATRSR